MSKPITSLTEIKESFLNDLQVTKEQLNLLTPEMLVGANELERIIYTPQEKKAIQLALYQFGQCKKEDISDVAQSWINEFSEMRMPFWEVIKRIRLAKHVKKYGVSEFAIFTNVKLSDFGDVYKYKSKTNYSQAGVPCEESPG